MFAGEGVLPDAEDAPAPGAQEAVDLAVALAVAGDFGVPEGAVGFRAPVVSGAAMPVTAVNKKGEALRGEDEVGPAGEFAVAPPAGDAAGAEDGDEAQLRVLVAGGADAGHDGGALGFGEDVRHRL